MTPSSYFDINLRFLTIRKSHRNIGLSQVVYKPGRLYLPFFSILTSSVMSKKESRLRISFYSCWQLIRIQSRKNYFFWRKLVKRRFSIVRQSRFLLLRYIIPKMAIRMILTSGVHRDVVHTHYFDKHKLKPFQHVLTFVFTAKSAPIALNSLGKQMYNLVRSVVLSKIGRDYLNRTFSSRVRCVL